MAKKRKKKRSPDWGGARPGAGRPRRCRRYAKLGVSIDLDVFESLDRYRLEAGKTKSEVVELALREFLSRQ